jgi:hypothetical protein
MFEPAADDGGDPVLVVTEIEGECRARREGPPAALATPTDRLAREDVNRGLPEGAIVRTFRELGCGEMNELVDEVEDCRLVTCRWAVESGGEN